MQIAAINIRDVPEALRDAVEHDARERNLSVNDVQGEVLADYYAVPWTHAGRRKNEYAYTGVDQWVIRLPLSLKELIRQHARASGNTMRGIVLLILARHYGLAPDPEGTGRRGGRVIDPEQLADLRARYEAGESIRSLHRATGIKREILTRAIRA